MEALQIIQAKLKAPKNQTNKFGGYNYRSCEDILEAVKPLLAEQKALLTISDDIIEVGGRVYIKATATFTHGEFTISNSAAAREAETKKGMDDSQITGTASSYARKYALNGLFLIDDTKDADTDEHRRQTSAQAATKPATPVDFDWLKERLDMVDDREGVNALKLETMKKFPRMSEADTKKLKTIFEKKEAAWK